MRKLLIVVVFLSLAGCYTQKKASKQIARAGIEYPELVLNACPTPKTETKYIPGKETHTSDTVVIEGKRIPCPPVVVNKDTVINWVDCPPSKVIHDTIRRIDTVFIQVENTAKLAAKDYELIQVRGLLKKAEDKASRRGKWNLYLGGFVLLLGVGAFVKLKFF